MDAQTPDPVDWGVDRVVEYLCNPQEAPWADSATSSRPNLTALEAALRDNLINGEALLHDVDREALRDDLGIKALGHRSSVLRAIDWLRARSPKYQTSKQNFPSSNQPPPTVEHLLSSVNSPITASADPPSRISSVPPPVPPPVPAEMTPAPAAAGMKEKRQIAPTPVVDFKGQNRGGDEAQEGKSSFDNCATGLSPQPISKSMQNNSTKTARGEESQKVSLSDPSNASIIPPDTAELESKLSKDRSSELTQKDHDFFAQLLLKHPVGGDVIPFLGESDAEYDEETQNEMEEDDLDSMSPISSTDCEGIFSDFIANHEEAWMAKHLPKHRPYAQLVWNQARNPRSGMGYKSGALRTLENLRLRLTKQKSALRDANYKSRIALRDACRVMETTLDQICFEEWRVQTMELETCPPFVPPPPRVSRPRRQRVVEADEESLGSDSDLAADDEASAEESDDDFVDDDFVDDDFVDDDFVDDIPHRPHKGLLGPIPADKRLVASTSDDSEEVFVAKKRRRMMESQHQSEGKIKVNASTPGPFAEFENGEMYLLSSPDHFSPSGALRLDSSPQALHDSDADGMLVETPPLNPTLPASSPQDVDMEDDFLVKTPPLNPTNLPRPSGKLRLTLSSPEVPTKVIKDNALRLPKKVTSRAVSLGKDNSDAISPSMDDIDIFDMVSVMSWENVEASRNPVWLLAKHLIGLPLDEKQHFGPYLEAFVDAVYMEEVTAALQAMLKNSWHLDGRTEEESKPAMRLGAYFVSWNSGQALNPRGMGREPLQKALEAIEEYDDLSEFIHFLHRLKKLHASFRAWLSRQPSRKEKQGNSTYSDSADSDSTSLKRKRLAKPRSKKPFGPRPLSNMQKDAQERQAKQDKDRERLRMARESKGLSNSDPEGQAVTFKEPVIYLHPHLGRYVKPHQLTGIQFMWRELIEANNQQGCLLAHTMGLGKSMQVISLLVTIADAAASDDPKIREQVPERFHRSQTLVLCPSSVVPNWSDEFAMWAPVDHHLGPIRLIAPRGRALEMSERLQTVHDWNRKGGILIMSYEMLRILIVNKPVRLNEEEHKLVEECLLEGPNIIVADEAHKLRSGKSAISQVASRFKSTSRIAMTGSPLSNQLFEYYQMVEWVAPGYLEDPNTFKRKFMDPIQAGSYMDSSRMEQRESLVSLQLLNGILAPKVLRADTSVLAADLPSKTEFVLTVPLTELQRNAYNTFVDCAKSKDVDASLKLWSWLAIMQLCCNHPFPFREKLADRLKQQEDTDNLSILPTSIQDAGLPSDLVSQMDALFSKYPNLEETALSNRAVVLDEILDLSIRANDKVLIFTQSIPTMNYLDLMLKNKGRKYQRIDGSTTGPDRQNATKRFNSGSSEQILLISTRAGGVGLNMFGANRVVIFDFLFNPMWEEQAVGRAYRLGQRKPVYVYRFLAGGTFEELIFNNAVFKRQLAVRVVDKKTVMRESSKKSSTYLTHVKDVEKDEKYPALGRDPQVLDQILGGELNEIILKARLSHIQDNENDRLTAEETRQVEYALKMERLKRSDPLAYHAEIKRRDDAEKIRQQEVARKLKQRELEKADEQRKLFQMSHAGQQQISQAGQQQGFLTEQQRLASLKRGPIPMSTVGRSPLSVNNRGAAGAAQPARFLSGADATPIPQDRPQLSAYQPSSSSLLLVGSTEQPAPPSTYKPSSSTLRQTDGGEARPTFKVPSGNEVIVIEDSSVPSTPVKAPVNALPLRSASSDNSPVSPTPNITGDVALENANQPTSVEMPLPSNQDESQGSAEHVKNTNMDLGGDGLVDQIDKNTEETAHNQATEPHPPAAVDQEKSDASNNGIPDPKATALRMADDDNALEKSANGPTDIGEDRHMDFGGDGSVSETAAVGASPNVPATCPASGQSEAMDTSDSSRVTVDTPAAGAATCSITSSQSEAMDIGDGA